MKTEASEGNDQQVDNSGMQPKRKNRLWRKEESETLKRLYSVEPTGAIAQQLDRTKGSVMRQARILGLTSTRGQRWTKAEIELLKKYYPTMSVIEAAKKLNRKKDSVACKARSLGLRSGGMGVVQRQMRQREQRAPMVPLLSGFEIMAICMPWNLGRLIKKAGRHKESLMTEVKMKAEPWTPVEDEKPLAHRRLEIRDEYGAVVEGWFDGATFFFVSGGTGNAVTHWRYRLYDTFSAPQARVIGASE